MKPEDIAGESESSQQRALFAKVNAELWQLKLQLEGPPPGAKIAWDGRDRRHLAPLRWFHSIPNGGSRGDDVRSRAIRGATMQAEGVIKGIPDTFLPVSKFDHVQGRILALGCYVEMKKPGIKVASAEQREFANYAVSVGYEWHLCDNWEKAFAVLSQYLTT